MVDQTSPAGHVPGRLRLGRGLFRLWAILSLLWMLGTSTVYWPEAREFYFNYETAMLDIVPVVLPRGQEGIRRETLTATQQNAVDYFVTHDEPTTKLEGYTKMLWWMDNDHGEFRFKLVPLRDLALPEVQSFRREWAEPRWRMFCEEFRDLVAFAIGIPLAAGLLAFLALRAGRWIWAGFAGPG